MRVGFIGIGNMGLPMAQRIQAQGHDLVLWARREASLAPFTGTSATVVASPAEMGGIVDCAGICVFDAKGVDEVLFGTDGVAETLRPGSVIMMHSTVSSAEVQQLAGKAAAYGLRLLDAPVSGGEPQASIGKLTVMVGGEQSALADVAPVLASFSDHVVHLGPVGAGSKAKLINNTLFSAQIVLADYAMTVGSSLGLDLDGLADVLMSSSSACIGSKIRLRTGSLGGIWASPAGAPLVKDVKLTREALGTAPGQELLEVADRFVEAVEAAARAQASPAS